MEEKKSEFQNSLFRPVKTDVHYRRIVATTADVQRFCREYTPPTEPDQFVELDYSGLEIAASTHTMQKMHGWVAERSEGHTLEVQGRFLARRKENRLVVDDFVPLPSFCQSLSYETESPDDREQRFGMARMRSIGIDDFKPMGTQFYLDLGIFADAEQIVIDPFRVPIPFHSHYLKSQYQDGPSPGDLDRIFHLKWLFAPVSGKNILYSGVTDAVVEVPYRFDPVARIEDAVPSPTNQHDCRVELLSGRHAGKVYMIPPGERGLLVGRGSECDIELDDDHASRRHARLFWSEDEELFLEDLGSSNGTKLDGRVIHEQAVPVDHTCEVRMGQTTLRIMI